MSCTNKGCNKEMEPLLDLDLNEVECTECGKPIKTTEFAKTSMKGIGQIKRAGKASQPYAIECKKCKKVLMPKIDADNKLACSVCSSEFENISVPFANLIREKLNGK